MAENKCPHCGASMKAWWERLTPGLVRCLIKAIQFVHEKGRNEFHLQRDLTLTKTEYANFQKLRFHALIAHVEGKEGYWLITKRGGQFLRDEIAVPDKVKTFRNKVIEHSTHVVRISDFRGKVPYFEREFAYETVGARSDSMQPALL